MGSPLSLCADIRNRHPPPQAAFDPRVAFEFPTHPSEEFTHMPSAPISQIPDPAVCSGVSRRSFFRFAAGASALATVPILTEAHLAWATRPTFADPNKGIHIDANE